MSKNYYLKNVVTLTLDENKCTGCGMCTKVCPHAVFSIVEKKAVLVDRDACMECGACAMNCPFEAVQVRSGVGCAAGIIAGILSNSEPNCGGPSCGCSGDTSPKEKSGCC